MHAPRRQHVHVLCRASVCSSLWSGLSSSYPPPSPLFFYFSFPSPLFVQCDGCLEDLHSSHGWVAGIASHESSTLSGGQLVGFPLEAPGITQAPNFHIAMQFSMVTINMHSSEINFEPSLLELDSHSLLCKFTYMYSFKKSPKFSGQVTCNLFQKLLTILSICML